MKLFLLHSNSCTCPVSSVWPSWGSRGVSCTVPTAPSAAWPETRTAPGTGRPAPGSSPPARGNEQGGSPPWDTALIQTSEFTTQWKSKCINVQRDLQIRFSLKGGGAAGGKPGQNPTERGRTRRRRRRDNTLYCGWNNTRYFLSLFLLSVSSFIIAVASYFHPWGGGRSPVTTERRRI